MLIQTFPEISPVSYPHFQHNVNPIPREKRAATSTATMTTELPAASEAFQFAKDGADFAKNMFEAWGAGKSAE